MVSSSRFLQTSRSVVRLAAISALLMSGCGGGDDEDGGETTAFGPGEGGGGDGARVVPPGDRDGPATNGPGSEGGDPPDPGVEPEDPAPGVDDPGEPTPIEPDPEPPPPAHSGTCQAKQFTALDEFAYVERFGFQYIAVDGDAFPLGVIYVMFRETHGFDGRLGFHDLAGSNLADCAVCVYALDGCNPATRSCQRTYIADEGAVELIESGGVGGQLVARLHNVRVKQATIDPATGRSTIMERGDTWCLNGYEIDLPLQGRPAEIGEPVRDFSLQNCASGEMVSVHELGQNAKAVWFIAAAGWCSACREFIPQVREAVASISGDLLKMMYVLGEDAQYRQPSLDYCKSYARRHGSDGSDFYIDHDGERSFATTFQNLWPYVSENGEFGLPWNGIVRGGSFIYEYADRSGRGDLSETVNRLLSAP